MLKFERVSAGYGDKNVLTDVSLCAPKGLVTALIGPNASGKTTLMRLAARLIRPRSGTISLDGRDAFDYTRREYAQRVALLPQTRDTPALTARALAAHGRYPHLAFPRRMGAADWEKVDGALGRAGAQGFADGALGALSGGERQRAYFSMALAQLGSVLLLDEPNSFLDAGCQFDLLNSVKALAREGKAVLIAVHSLSLALEYADQAAVLQNGRLVACAPPGEIPLELLDGVFGVRVRRARTEDGEGHFIVLPRQ